MKEKVGLLIATTMIFVVVAFWGSYYEKNNIRGVPVVKIQEWEALAEQQELIEINVNLLF